ncbi:uncharacterized protein LOC125816305 [Solanum verrucosum]|uniref:uncharacterized protein LOC125816305 n=1 Tax=Solanum verrucosum TaxID=315347 RepID=UPI0020D1E1D0|nr:uncharacterized protein LOC125816305 [Solanum verrucosum]
MAEGRATKYAVVTGANKGIGFEICRQLASHGVLVILGARDEKRGIEALEKLKGFGLAENVVFHQLDVVDKSSIDSLAEFIKTKFGRLDILVNNAGIAGVNADADALRAKQESSGTGGSQVNWNDILTQSFELAKECLETNYYGVKRMTEACIPLLQLSKSPRIVNVSSSMGKLKNLKHEWAKGVLNDSENLTEEKIEEVINQYLKDFKEDSLQAKGWPSLMSAYIVSKAAMNAYSRVMAKKHPSIQINCVCPGFVKTDINFNSGILSVEEGAESPVRLALQTDDGPSGLFFDRKEVSSFEVNNAGVSGSMVEGNCNILTIKDLIEGDFVTISTENEEEDESVMEKSIEGIVTNYELTKQCIETNFYGAKRISEAFIPLLQLSNSPRIVNVASFLGKLKTKRLNIKNLDLTFILSTMAGEISTLQSTRYAVVTGGNKGIGYETCKQLLASKGVVVVLTSRDEKRGIEAIERLKKESNITNNNDQILFHQLDVMDPASISSLVDFINTKFGRLDILVNNAGVGGLMVEGNLVILKNLVEGDFVTISTENEEEDESVMEKSIEGIVTNYELTKQCLETNYYGAKRMIEAFAPLLQLSNSPRIVNVASFLGKLKLLCNEWAKNVLSDAKSLTEERIDLVLNEFLKDFTENSVEAKGWPSYFAAYKVSKAALIAYTRVLGSKYPNFRVNSVCPGYCGTDMTAYTGSLTAEEGAESLVKLALLPNDGPSGVFFYRKDVTSF